MNFIYTEEFRLRINSIWDRHLIPKLVINQSGVAVLYMTFIEYQYDILGIIPCKYTRFNYRRGVIKSYSNEDLNLPCFYDPKLSLPIYCWFRHLPDFLELQRKIEEVIEGQRFSKFAKYDLQICYVV